MLGEGWYQSFELLRSSGDEFQDLRFTKLEEAILLSSVASAGRVAHSEHLVLVRGMVKR